MPVENAPDLGFLASLIDHRTEDLDIEYKAWMDLSGNEARAKIAKHICALANYGGGWLIFGVNDDGSIDQDRPTTLDAYNQDAINGMAARYLVPPVHCQVHHVASPRTNGPHPIVRVPPHGAVPICAKASGPTVNGGPVGIAKGTHYVRDTGPRSVPVNSPELWRDLIHRCVINERESLLGSIGRLFDKPVAARGGGLDELLDLAIAEWVENVPTSATWGLAARSNRTAFAYRFLTEGGGVPLSLSLDALKTALREASNASFAAMNYNLPFGLQSGVPGEEARVGVFDEAEGFQASMISSGGSLARTPILWRSMEDGSGFEVRLQTEDAPWFAEAMRERRSSGWEIGKRFVPIFHMRRAWQFAFFARELANRFKNVATVELAVDYAGLRGRKLDDPDPHATFFHQIAAVDSRRVKVSTTPGAMSGEGVTDAAIALIAPILRLFDGYAMTPDHVRRRLHAF